MQRLQPKQTASPRSSWSPADFRRNISSNATLRRRPNGISLVQAIVTTPIAATLQPSQTPFGGFHDGAEPQLQSSARQEETKMAQLWNGASLSSLRRQADGAVSSSSQMASQASQMRKAVVGPVAKRKRQRRQQKEGQRKQKWVRDPLAQGATAITAPPPPGKAPMARSMKKNRKIQIPPKEADLMRWYSDVLQAAELANKHFAKSVGAPSFQHMLQGPVKAWLDERLDYMGFEDRAFPQLMALSMPESSNDSCSSSSKSSSSSSQSMQPEAGPEPCASPGTCTTHTFAHWVRSEGAMPVLASQWRGAQSWQLGDASAVLHESHAVHAWSGTAEEHAQAMIGLYAELMRDAAGLPAIAGRKSRSGTLPGAVSTFTVEALVGNGRAMQVAASHHLADNYSRMLGASYQDNNGDEEYPSQMGSILHTTALGGMVLVHGDDKGMRLPPALAPSQVVLASILKDGRDKNALATEVGRIRSILERAGVRVEVDDRRCTPGIKFGASERRGVPLRIEVGPSDLKDRTCTMARRDMPGPQGRRGGMSTDADILVDTVLDLLDEAQSEMRWQAAAVLATDVIDVFSFIELRDVIEAGKWARAPWAGSIEDEASIFEETGAMLRCFPLQQPINVMSGYNTCIYSGFQATEVAVFARPM